MKMASEPPSAVPLFAGTEVGTLLKCNQKLQDLGVDTTITLPRVVLVGDQSSGKSSLVEALCHVRIPRAAGCCTQCPLAVNLIAPKSTSSTFECKIYVEERFTYRKPRTKDNRNAPRRWTPRELATTHFKTTFDENEVCNLVMAAQQAILNPRKPNSQSSPELATENSVVKFSPNVVRLDISRGGLPNLSFIDLPGIIASSESDEESYLVAFVDSLVESYAQDPDTIVLLTLSMSNDLANSKARALIQKIKAESRTLPVLTKPDRAQGDSHKEYFNKFLGLESSTFGHQYMIVMMDPDTQLEQSEARHRESRFFSKAPWNALGKPEQNRLGVSALRSFLQDLLFSKTRENLPENLTQIEIRLQEISGQLDKLPIPPQASEIPIILERITTALAENLHQVFHGFNDGGQVSFRRQFNDYAMSFRHHLAVSHPVFILITDDDRAREAAATMKAEQHARDPVRNATSAALIDISSDDETDSRPPPPRPPKKSTQTKRKSREENNSNRSRADEGAPRRFTLEEVREVNQRHSLVGMGREPYPQAMKEMMLMSVSNWSSSLEEFMQAVSELTNAQVLVLVKSVLRQYADFAVFSTIENWVNDYLAAVIQTEQTQAVILLAAEQSLPYTLAVEQQAAKSKQNLDEKLAKRNGIRTRIMQAEMAAGSGKASKRAPAVDTLGPDDYQVEIEMAARVRGYYDIAAGRFTDVVCQGIGARLFNACSGNLVRNLKDFIGVDRAEEQEKLRRWFMEEAGSKRERESLLRERSKLIEGKEYITIALGLCNNDNNDPTPSRPASTPDNTPAKSRYTSRLPSTPLKRSPPGDFDNNPASSNKKLAGLSCLNLRSERNDEGSPGFQEDIDMHSFE